ncbi:MAG: TonB-dependent receptor [Phreatobacter sp.]|uniref:TonB-dependent receptor n=1 Tax=Phreatobacter sp. TaxID=1966341 RepID=UPI002734AF35|nr:TonB-dependent receptor [Phreatobacter sp.]MDP2803639.1 TonB-dependent receptor [Phreatobacter sp.]
MRPARLALSPASLVVLALAISPASAQTALPEILIEAPRNPDGASRDLGLTDGQLRVIDRAFVPVTVIPESEIRRNGGSTLGDQLANVPGVTGSSFAPGGASRPIIRGLDNARIRIQENGIGAQDVSDLSEDHAVPIDPLAAERIEVIRGPAALRFGSQAIGGVVNVTNERIPTRLGPPGVSGMMTGGLSSVDRGIDGAARVRGSSGQWAFSADVFGRNAGDYATPQGRQDNSFARTFGGSFGASYFFDQGYIGAAISQFRSLYGIPGAGSAADRVRIDMVQTRLTSRGEIRFDGAVVDNVRFWLGGSLYRHNEQALELGAFATASTFRNQELEGRFETAFRPFETGFGTLNTTFGMQFGAQSLGTSGEAGGLLAPTHTRTAAAFLFNELALSPTTRLQAAARIEQARVGGTAALFPAGLDPAGGAPAEFAAVRNFAPMSASLGLLQNLPGGWVASLTGQYVERAPRAQELYSKGPHEASGTFEIGDPNLRKERAQTIELGLRRAQGAWRVDATAFYTRYAGFIYKRLTGLTCDDDFATCGSGGGTELRQLGFAQQDATFYGTELRGQVDIGEFAGGTFGVEGQYDFVRATFAGGTNVPRIPPHRLGGGLFWRDANWFARVTLLHAFAQNQNAAEETPTPGYNLLNAEISYRMALKPGSGAESLTFGVVGTNLLNADIRNHVSFKKDEVLMPGRGVRFFTTVRF